MAQQKANWVKLDSIIYEYISEAELSANKYFKLYHIAYRGLQDLGLDFFNQIKSVKLVVNANKTVNLPADFLQYTKIGILNGLGELIPLRYNDKLTSFNDLHLTRLSDTSSLDFAGYYSFSSPTFYNYWDGNGLGNLYGISGAGLYGGGFKIDNTNGVILLDASFSYSELIMEYSAAPDESQDLYAPIEFREALIAWIAWRDLANLQTSRRGNLGDKRDRRHEWFEARRLGMGKYRPFYLDQAYMNNQETMRLSIKG